MFDHRLAKSHCPGQCPDIALVPGQYLDTAPTAGHCKIILYCPAKPLIRPDKVLHNECA